MGHVAMNDSDFLKWVQLHERAWGDKSYRHRPTLADILASPLVSFWTPLKGNDELKMRVRLHQSLDEIERCFLRLIQRNAANPPEEKIVRLYQNRERMIIKRVRIEFAPAPAKREDAFNLGYEIE